MPERPNASRLFTADEIAPFLRVSSDTVRVWARAGKIPVIRLGHRTHRFDLDEVLAAIRKASSGLGEAK